MFVISEYDYIRLNDLEVVATLGVGGFGRVELVQYVQDPSLTFALKCLKKQHIVDTQQQEHVFSEKIIMMSCRSPFICRWVRIKKLCKVQIKYFRSNFHTVRRFPRRF